jgi:hypothetical protein
VITTDWVFVVEVRSHFAATTIGTLGFKVAGLPVHALEFLVTIDQATIPEQPDIEQQIEAQRRAAAERAAENMALAEWAPGKYLLIIRGKDSATNYTATIDDQRKYSVQRGW